MNKILVDTNVLIYLVDEDSQFFKPARNLISDTSLNPYTTSKNLSEFLAVMTRIPKNSLSINDALTVIKEFNTVFNILYPTKASCDILMDLLKTYQPAGLQIHDFEIAGIGLANGINRIATFNRKDFIRISEIDLYPL